MRTSSSWLAALMLLSSASPVLAQKIAPSRQYGAAVDGYAGPSDAPSRTYTPPPRTSEPDKNFGLPTFGNPVANMPRQRATIPPKPQTEEVAPGVQQALPLPQPEIAAPDDTDPVADAFTRSAGAEQLPSQAALRASGSETPLFTTSDDAAGPPRARPGTTAAAPRPDPLFTTGPATPAPAASTVESERLPADRTPLDSARTPNPLAVTR